MSFAKSKGERLADHLRECIQRGELAEPLPGTIAWSRSLGVARDTLCQALRILRREGLIDVHARGHRLIHSREKPVSHAAESLRVVRLLYCTHEVSDLNTSMDWLFPLAERLWERGIQFRVEPCSDARLRSIASQPKLSHELFFLVGFPPRQQRWFSQSGKAALIIGSPAKGISLPSDQVDQPGAVLHATQLLLRKGFDRLTLLIAQLAGPGIKESLDAFESACAEWPHQPIHRQPVFIRLDDGEDVSVARRVASRVQGRQGIVVVGPVQPGLIMTALLERGIRIPDQVGVVAVWPALAKVSLCPPIPFYRMPNLRYVKKIVDITEHYFESGEFPRKIGKFLLELVQPPQAA